MQGIFTVLKNMFEEKTDFVPKHANMAVKWWLSLVSVYILKRYRDNFKEQFSFLISSYFLFSERFTEKERLIPP